MPSARASRSQLLLAVSSSVMALVIARATLAEAPPSATEPQAAPSATEPVAPTPAPEPKPAETPPSAVFDVRSPLRAAIAETRGLAESLIKRVFALKGNNSLSPADARAQEDAINSLTTLVASFDERAITLEKLKAASPEAERASIENDEEALSKQVGLAKDALAAIGTQLQSLATASGWDLIDKLLTARCSTAICFDNGPARHWLGIEPLVELPIGIGFAVGSSSLTDYVNNHDLRVDLAAGARVWLFRDVVSLSVYISKPLIDSSIRLRGSDFVYPGSSVRRPYPGFALGFLFDSIWLGFDRNELRNGDGKDGSALSPDFPPNAVVSSAWTITLALEPVTAFRTAIGTAVQSNKAGSQ